MNVVIDTEDKIVIARLSGEVDHHNAKSIRADIDLAIDRHHPERLVLDFDDVTFMDSSGIGLIMGRYKLMSAYSGQIEVVNVPLNMARVVRLSGIEKLGKITVKES